MPRTPTSHFQSAVLALIVVGLLAASPAAHAHEPSSSAKLEAAIRGLVFTPWMARFQATSERAGSMMKSRPHAYAMRLYLLERELTTALEYVANHPKIPSATKVRLTDDMKSMYAQLEYNTNTVISEMRRRMEAKAPGTTGCTNVQCVNGQDLYFPTYKAAMPVDAADAAKKYSEVLTKWRAAHPQGALYTVLDRRTFRAIPSGQNVDWVAMPSGEIRLTSAKHVLASEGHPVGSSGGLLVLWKGSGPRKKPIVVPLSNWSGTFQTDIASVAVLRDKLLQFGVPADSMFLTQNMVGTSKVYENLVEAKRDESFAKKRAARLNQIADQRVSWLQQRWDSAIAPLLGGARRSKDAVRKGAEVRTASGVRAGSGVRKGSDVRKGSEVRKGSAGQTPRFPLAGTP